MGKDGVLYPQVPRIDALRRSSAVWLIATAVACGDRAEPSSGRGQEGADNVSASVQVVDDANREVRLARPATRVVSLVPGATETILALGGGAALVARTDYDEDFRLAHLPSIGGGLTPSLELIASLQPDLVIAWEEAGSARIRPRLESLGVPVYADQTRDTAGIYSSIERLGRLLGLDAAADSVAVSIRRELELVRESVRALRRPPVVYLVSLDPPMAASSGLYIGEMIEVAGGRNVFADLAEPSPQISLEEIVRRQPEIILIPSGGDEGPIIDRLRRTPGWSGLLASGTARVATLPADILHRPGPAVVGAARALRDSMHGSGESGQ